MVGGSLFSQWLGGTRASDPPAVPVATLSFRAACWRYESAME